MRTALFVLGVMLFGCIDMDEPRSDEASPAALESSAEALAFCSSEGGTCRKSVCRANEERDDRLECGTDAQCCVPIEDAQAFATCESVGGTCRKSRCRANERLDLRSECGTDAACCVPAP